MATHAPQMVKEIHVGNKRLLAVSLDGRAWIWPASTAATVQRETEARRQAMGRTARRLFGKLGEKSG